MLLEVGLILLQEGTPRVGAAEISVEEAQQSTSLDAANDGAMLDPGVARREDHATTGQDHKTEFGPCQQKNADAMSTDRC